MGPLWTEIASWWLRLAFAGAALLLAALALIAALRQPAYRLRAGGWALAVALLLPVLALLPAWVALPASFAAPVRAVTGTSRAKAVEESRVERPADEAPAIDLGFAAALPLLEDADVPAQPLVASREAIATASAEPQTAATLLPWILNSLLAAYALIVILLLARLIVGHRQLVRLWAAGRPAPVEVRRLFHRLARGLRRKPALRVSDRVAGPICFGVLRPRVVLPADFAAGDERRLRWVLGHELGHLERRDPLVGWLLGLAGALFFFVPWFGKLRRSIRLAQEYLADADALRAAAPLNETSSVTPAEDYADFLVRLTTVAEVPAGAAGVKTPSSDLFRRVTMLLQNSGDVERRCPRRWSLIAGGGLLALGVALAGAHFGARDVAAADEKKVEPPKKESVEDVEDAIRKALESLKKGPEPLKEEKKDAAPADNSKNAEEAFRQAEEAMNKAREAMSKNPGSAEAQRNFSEAVRRYQEAFRNRMQARQPQFQPPQFQPPALPQLPQFQPQPVPFPQLPLIPQLQPLEPGDFDQLNDELQKMLEDLQKQLQMNPFDPNLFPGGANPRLRMIGPGLGRAARLGDVRLGILLEKPNATLVEQLDLPANKGLVVAQVAPESVAAKAGIKPNDILLEIGGKPVPGEAAELRELLAGIKAGDKVDVVVLRKGKRETIKDVKLPEAKRPNPANLPRAQPLLPRLDLRNPNGFPPEAFGGRGNGTRMSVSDVNGEVTIKYNENGLDYTIVGAREDGAFTPSRIEVRDGEKTVKANSLEKLDAQYRPTAERLIKQVR
jgi:beta-lactamase regulating signal transducer with metallopeptidase domain